MRKVLYWKMLSLSDYFKMCLILSIQYKDSCRVIENPTIICQAAYCGNCFLFVYIKSVVYYLMCPAEHRKFILFQKVLGNPIMEIIAKSSFRCAPNQRILFIAWVCPYQITSQSYLRGLQRSSYSVYILNQFQLWAQSSVTTKYLIFYYCCKRQRAKKLACFCKSFRSKSLQTFIIKSIASGKSNGIMTSPQHKEIILQLNFQAHKECQTLYTTFSSPYIISQKQIIIQVWMTTFIKYIRQISIIADSPSGDIDGSIQFQERWLFEQQTSGDATESDKLFLCNINFLIFMLCRRILKRFEQTINININLIRLIDF